MPADRAAGIVRAANRAEIVATVATKPVAPDDARSLAQGTIHPTAG